MFLGTENIIFGLKSVFWFKVLKKPACFGKGARASTIALCKVIARDANEALAKIDTDRFSRYAMDWNRVDLKNAIGARKQAMLNAVAGFDQMLATLENM